MSNFNSNQCFTKCEQENVYLCATTCMGDVPENGRVRPKHVLAAYMSECKMRVGVREQPAQQGTCSGQLKRDNQSSEQTILYIFIL